MGPGEPGGGGGRPEPVIEATLRITLRGELANIEAVAELTAALDTLLAARYADYRGTSIALDAHMAGPMPSPADQAFAERVAREHGIIP